MAAVNGYGVKQTHADYNKRKKQWKRARDVVSGQDAVRDAKIEYLPYLKDEDSIEYGARLSRATFYNASWRTVGGFVGMLFRKEPKLEVPTKVEEYLKDVTMSGVNFTEFAKQVATEDLTTSRVGVLVDYPKREPNEELTLAQAEALGLRPSMQIYKAENIINWRKSFVNNKTILTQVRLTETKEVEGATEFNSITEEVIRVLDLFNGKYRVRIFKAADESQIGVDAFPEMNGKPLDYIPFYLIGPDGVDIDVYEPVLIDLFDLNIQHWKVSADYEHACHMTGLPTPWVTGYQQNAEKPETFYIGSTSAWIFPDPNAKVGFLEFEGKGLDELRTNLENKEKQMAALGARMLAPEKTGVEAAETLGMRHAGEHSVLASIAIAVSLGLLEALKTFCKWSGVEEEVDFEINREFMPVVMDPAKLTALMATVQGGYMSKQSFFDLMKRDDLIAHDIDYETEQARIASDPPPAPIAPLDAQLGEKQQHEKDKLAQQHEANPPKPATK